MSLEDPFFVVKDEVQKAVQTARSLYQRWCELLDDPVTVSKEEYDWTSNELRNSLRSIEWDLEDLEETIIERNPKKFKIDDVELNDRKAFVARTKHTVQDMKDHLSSPQTRSREDKKTRQAANERQAEQLSWEYMKEGHILQHEKDPDVRGLLANGPKKPQDKYMRLENEIERANQKYIEDSHQQQQLMMTSQDDQIDMIGTSVGVLKNMSHQIGNEMDEQAVMLDDFAHEMDTTESKMDNVMKKMAKVLHMSNDRRQWCAIGVLLLIMVIVIILFFVL